MTCPKCRRAMKRTLVCYDDGSGEDYDVFRCLYCYQEIESPDKETRRIDALFRKLTEVYTSQRRELRGGRVRSRSRRRASSRTRVRETTMQLQQPFLHWSIKVER